MFSEEAQRFLAENTTSRNVREVEYKNDVMTPLADIKLILRGQGCHRPHLRAEGKRFRTL